MVALNFIAYFWNASVLIESNYLYVWNKSLFHLIQRLYYGMIRNFFNALFFGAKSAEGFLKTSAKMVPENELPRNQCES